MGKEQKMTARVTVEEVQRVAELAHLELTPEETPRILNDLNAILDYVAELNELDTSGVAPLAQVSELLDGGQRRAARRSCPAVARTRRSLSQAPETDGVFFQGSQARPHCAGQVTGCSRGSRTFPLTCSGAR